jgi:hypothetical protein
LTWRKFLNNKTTNLNHKNSRFGLTYLPSDDAFVIQNSEHTYITLKRYLGKTYLFDTDVLYRKPKKGEEPYDTKLRLSVVLRDIRDSDGAYHVITIGLKDFGEKFGSKMKYHKIADFPFSKSSGKVRLEDSDYEQFGFEVERPSPWPDKDEFGEIESHPWDDQTTYKHESGLEIIENS